MATAMKKFWFAVPIVLIGIFGILRGSGIATAAYNLIENGGSALTMRPTLNFVNSGCADNPTDNRTDCTISGGGSAYATIQNNGTPLTQRSILNFTTNITCMDDSGNMSTDCAASGGGSGGGAGLPVYSANSIVLLGTQYIPVGGGAAVSSTESAVQVKAPAAATVSNLSVQLSAALGIGASAVFTWRDGGSSQALTCTISGVSATSCQDTTHSFSAAQGDEIDIQSVTTGAPAAVTVVVATQYGISGSSGGGFIQPLTAPIAANFSQVNFNMGSGVVSTQVNNSTPVTSITINQNDPNGLNEIAALAKSPINAAFTITLGMSYLGGGTPCVGGMWLYDGSSNNILFGVENDMVGFTIAQVYSNLQGAFVGNVYAANAIGLGPLLWFRIQETASARNYSLSSDGTNFYQVATESNTAHFTTTKYGFMSECRSPSDGTYSTITVYSFTETTP